MELSKEINIGNMIRSNEFEKEIYKESVVSFLVVKVFGDSLVELPKKNLVNGYVFKDKPMIIQFGRNPLMERLTMSISPHGEDVQSKLLTNIHIWKKVSKVQILSPSDMELSYFATFWSTGGCRKGDAMLLFDEMHDRNVVTSNVMITGLVKWGKLEFASFLYDEMPEKNVVSWTGIIDGYIRSNMYSEGLSLFQRMVLCEGIKPTEITILAILPAISNMWGSKRKNLVSWKSIISGFAMHGTWKEAGEYFERMEKIGLRPNRATFLSVLNACSHGGLFDGGLRFFDKMVNKHGVSPDIEHYGCLVDMLGITGRLEEAENMALEIPNEIVIVVIWIPVGCL
ncbi:hypothetical protein NC653_040988 [Populus alba x Populus x berolinensis]|uniref:Pentatricopeptide repeat-containing protein n=1 Tax=Populus alba x Populus x berolinensis TaxID=444605 RepID=A0AAD6PQ87_9ROSI|nr:hypothetical protein NC653_040988 [Populus alba x Populus x berolinensis]